MPSGRFAGPAAALEGAVSMTGAGVAGAASSANAADCGRINAAIIDTILARCKSMGILQALPIRPQVYDIVSRQETGKRHTPP